MRKWQGENKLLNFRNSFIYFRKVNNLCLSSRQAGHIELAERLVECQYELTDRLAFYLCGRRPGNASVFVHLTCF